MSEELQAEVEQLRKESAMWRDTARKWQSKWHSRMDELTATKGELARLRKEFDEYISIDLIRVPPL